jgi:hypothetical protein
MKTRQPTVQFFTKRSIGGLRFLRKNYLGDPHLPPDRPPAGYQYLGRPAHWYPPSPDWRFKDWVTGVIRRSGYGPDHAVSPLQKTLLVPFRGVRYHLREQALTKLQPANE